MKKILLVLCMAVALVGCSSNSAANIAGEWKLISIAAGENVIEGDELVAIYPDGIVYDFSEDGTMLITSFGQDAGATWTVEGNVVTMEKIEGTVTGTVDGDTITFEEGGLDFVLEKVK